MIRSSRKTSIPASSRRRPCVWPWLRELGFLRGLDPCLLHHHGRVGMPRRVRVRIQRGISVEVICRAQVWCGLSIRRPWCGSGSRRMRDQWRWVARWRHGCWVTRRPWISRRYSVCVASLHRRLIHGHWRWGWRSCSAEAPQSECDNDEDHYATDHGSSNDSSIA